MGVCLIVIIMLEIIYRGKGVSVGDFCFGYMLVIAYLIFVPFTDIIEKYFPFFSLKKNYNFTEHCGFIILISSKFFHLNYLNHFYFFI